VRSAYGKVSVSYLKIRVLNADLVRARARQKSRDKVEKMTKEEIRKLLEDRGFPEGKVSHAPAPAPAVQRLCVVEPRTCGCATCVRCGSPDFHHQTDATAMSTPPFVDHLTRPGSEFLPWFGTWGTTRRHVSHRGWGWVRAVARIACAVVPLQPQAEL